MQLNIGQVVSTPFGKFERTYGKEQPGYEDDFDITFTPASSENGLHLRIREHNGEWFVCSFISQAMLEDACMCFAQLHLGIEDYYRQIVEDRGQEKQYAAK